MNVSNIVQEFINIEIEEFESLTNLIDKKINLLVIGFEADSTLMKEISNILYDKNDEWIGNICSSDFSKYTFFDPEKLYKVYNKLFNNRFFIDNQFLLFDNIELGLQQCFQVKDCLVDKKIFFVNCRQTVMNADPINYDYIFLNVCSLKIYNKYFKEIFEEYEYFEYLIKEIVSFSQYAIYDVLNNKFMFKKVAKISNYN